jgi:hypothetical protein
MHNPPHPEPLLLRSARTVRRAAMDFGRSESSVVVCLGLSVGQKTS